MNEDAVRAPVSVDPEIVRYIRAFAARRRRLIRLRGACLLAMVLIGALTLAAFADRWFVLEDAGRAMLSAAAYLLAGVVVWRMWVRRLRIGADERQMARLCETVRPDLREDLLSAIELTDAAGRHEWESVAFRRLLQQDVARRLLQRPVDELLPRRLIVAWIRGAVAAFVAVGALLLAPGLQFHRLLLRVALPMANIDRVSHTRIRVVEPSPASAIVPRGEPVRVTAELSGRPAEDVWLEATRSGEARERLRMRPSGPSRFSVDLDAAADEIVYRVRAGDGLTRHFRLTAVSPPRVVQFHKTYAHPAYTGLPTNTVAELHGDIEAIEGTDVTLALELDQPVREGELRVEVGHATNAVPLKSGRGGRASATLAMRESGTYRVHLVARRTGFANRFSPQYEIRVQPDLVPSVTIESPESDLAVRPDEIVDLNARVRDDLGLTGIVQMFRVNQGPWVTTNEAALGRERETALRRRWDLVALGLRPGDQLFTKFVATDLKGSRGESTVLRLMITAPGFDPERLKAVAARRQVAATADRLRRQAEEMEKTVDAARSEIERNPGDREAVRQAALRAAEAGRSFRESIEQAREEVAEALRRMPRGQASEEMVLAGRALSRTQRERLERAAKTLPSVAQAEAPDAVRKRAQEATDLLKQAVWDTQHLDRALERMTAAAAAQVAQADVEELAREQRRIHAASQAGGADPVARAQAARREAAAAAQTEGVSAMMKDIADDLRNQGAARRAEEIGERAKKFSEEARLASAEAQDAAANKPLPSDRLLAGTEDLRNQLQPFAEELQREAVKARKELARNLGDAAQSFWRLAEAEARATDLAKQGANPAERETAQASADAARDAAAGLLRDRAALEERRPDTDAQFVHDLNTAAEVAEHRPPTPAAVEKAAAERAREAGGAMRKLEAAHDLTAAAQATGDLAAGERWQNQPTPARDRAREWDRIEDTLPGIERDLRESGLPREAIAAVSKARQQPAAEEVRREMNARRDPNRPAASAAQPLDQVGGTLKEGLTAARPAIEEARTRLAAMAPTLPERMESLAREARGLEQQTAQRAEEARQGPAEAADLLASQEGLNEKLDHLRESLRRDAGVQDLASPEGRERARDADDALAMLRQPPPRAEDLLRQAAAAAPANRAMPLAQANEPQDQTADALEQLAQHYQNVASGQPEPTRSALRQMESDLGLKGLMQGEYERAAELSEMAGASPDQLMAALEDELRGNEAMRRELDRIADDTLNRAARQLGETAERQAQVASQVGETAQQRDQAGPSLREQAQAAAQGAREIAQHDAPQAAAKARPNAAGAAQKAEHAASLAGETAAQIPQDLPAGDLAAAARKTEQLAQMMRQAQGDLQAAAGEAQGPAPDAAGQANAAAGKAGTVAQQLSNLAGQLKQAAEREAGVLSAAASRQAPLPPSAGEAGSDIARAGRHEERLGQPAGEALQQVGERTQGTAAGEMSQAAQAMSAAPALAPVAAPAASQASAEIQKRVGELQEAMAAAAAAPASSAQGDMSDPAAAWLARALDQLDQSQHPGAPAPSAPSPSDMPASMAQAARAQAAGMQQARVQGAVPGETLADGAPVRVAPRLDSGEAAALPDAVALKDWGRLPTRMARDLMDAQHETVPEGYREMVDAYFRIVAEEARKANP